MSTYSGDQPIVAAMVIDGATTNLTTAQLKAASPANTVYTFSTFYSLVYNGQTVSFRPNYPYVLDASLKAALLAAGAPMTAA